MLAIRSHRQFASLYLYFNQRDRSFFISYRTDVIMQNSFDIANREVGIVKNSFNQFFI